MCMEGVCYILFVCFVLLAFLFFGFFIFLAYMVIIFNKAYHRILNKGDTTKSRSKTQCT